MGDQSQMDNRDLFE